MLLAFSREGNGLGVGVFAHAWKMASCALGKSLR
jgi:hypothetical protein